MIAPHHPIWDFIEMECVTRELRQETGEALGEESFYRHGGSMLIAADIEKYAKENNGHSDF